MKWSGFSGSQSQVAFEEETGILIKMAMQIYRSEKCDPSQGVSAQKQEGTSLEPWDSVPVDTLSPAVRDLLVL